MLSDHYENCLLTFTFLQNYIYVDGSIGNGEESNFWSSSPRSDSPSPNNHGQNNLVGPYEIYTPMQYTNDHRHGTFRTGLTFRR